MKSVTILLSLLILCSSAFADGSELYCPKASDLRVSTMDHCEAELEYFICYIDGHDDNISYEVSITNVQAESEADAYQTIQGLLSKINGPHGKISIESDEFGDYGVCHYSLPILTQIKIQALVYPR